MADSTIAHAIVSELPANIGSALALVPALEWAKRSPLLSWVTHQTAPFISVVAAGFIAAGIHSTYDASTGTFIMTGATAWGLLQVLGEICKQWLGQHWTYKLYQAFDTVKSVALTLSKTMDVATPSVSGATTTGTGNGKL